MFYVMNLPKISEITPGTPSQCLSKYNVPLPLEGGIRLRRRREQEDNKSRGRGLGILLIREQNKTRLVSKSGSVRNPFLEDRVYVEFI